MEFKKLEYIPHLQKVVLWNVVCVRVLPDKIEESKRHNSLKPFIYHVFKQEKKGVYEIAFQRSLAAEKCSLNYITVYLIR